MGRALEQPRHEPEGNATWLNSLSSDAGKLLRAQWLHFRRGECGGPEHLG